jgi:N-acetylglucosamine-6-phosphate deacetylase
MASLTPARMLGMQRNLGALRHGATADLVVLDRNQQVRMTLVGGRIVFQRKGTK